VRYAPSRPLIHEPVRAAVAVGAVLTLVGSAISWASGEPLDDVTFTPLVRSSGPIFVAATLVLAGLALNRSAAESRVRTMQALPAALGVILVLAWLESLRDVASFLADGVDRGWHSTGPVGPVITGIGVATMAAAGVLLSANAWRRNGTSRDAGYKLPTRASVMRGVIEVIGGAIGAALSIAAFAPTLVAILIPVMIFVVLLGAAAGVSVARRVARFALPETDAQRRR